MPRPAGGLTDLERLCRRWSSWWAGTSHCGCGAPRAPPSGWSRGRRRRGRRRSGRTRVGSTRPTAPPGSPRCRRRGRAGTGRPCGWSSASARSSTPRRGSRWSRPWPAAEAERQAGQVAAELSDRYEEIDLVYTISEILGHTVRLDEAARRILQEVATVVGARRASRSCSTSTVTCCGSSPPRAWSRRMWIRSSSTIPSR